MQDASLAGETLVAMLTDSFIKTEAAPLLRPTTLLPFLVMQDSSLAGETLLAGFTGGVAESEDAAASAAQPAAEAAHALDVVQLRWRLAWPLTEVITEVGLGFCTCLSLPCWTRSATLLPMCKVSYKVCVGGFLCLACMFREICFAGSSITCRAVCFVGSE